LGEKATHGGTLETRRRRGKPACAAVPEIPSRELANGFPPCRSGSKIRIITKGRSEAPGGVCEDMAHRLKARSGWGWGGLVVGIVTI
jgi:hypothetical protein